MDDTPAERAGITNGDVIEKISLPEKIESISATEIRNKNDGRTSCRN